MRDAVAALVAAALIFVALSLLTTLHFYRKRHRAARDEEIARGRTIVAELPTDPQLTLFTEDDRHFYYGGTPIAKDSIRSVRVLINGAQIASWSAPGAPPVRHEEPPDRSATLAEPEEGILRDRWDVAIDTAGGTVLVECGAVRQRVSQELARTIYETVTTRLQRDRHDG